MATTTSTGKSEDTFTVSILFGFTSNGMVTTLRYPPSTVRSRSPTETTSGP